MKCDCGAITYYGDKKKDFGMCESCYVGELEMIADQYESMSERVKELEEEIVLQGKRSKYNFDAWTYTQAEADKLKGILEYLSDKDNWYVEKNSYLQPIQEGSNWMVLRRQRFDPENGAYIDPWEYIEMRLGDKE